MRYVIGLCLFIFLSSYGFCIAPKSRIIVLGNEKNVLYSDRENSDFFGIGKLKKGIFTMTLRTKKTEDGVTVRSNVFSGKMLFGLIYSHFGEEKIRAIKSIWDKKSGLIDNLIAFNQNVTDGMPLEDAAFNTWSGKIVSEYGYDRAIIQKSKKLSGQYVYVEVLFVKNKAEDSLYSLTFFAPVSTAS